MSACGRISSSIPALTSFDDPSVHYVGRVIEQIRDAAGDRDVDVRLLEEIDGAFAHCSHCRSDGRILTLQDDRHPFAA